MREINNQDNMVWVDNKYSYLAMGWFTEEEINNADEKGLIGRKDGMDCYVSKYIPTVNH